MLGAATAARLVAAGHTVHGFDRIEHAVAGVTTHRVDLLGISSAFRWPDDAEAVLHLAGTWQSPTSDPRGLTAHLRANVELVARSLAACAPSVRRFVYVSSMSVYGRDAVAPYCEDSPLRPDSFYGRTKWLGEQVCRMAQDLRPELEVVILRLAQVYGPGTPPRVVLYDFIAQALANQSIRAQCGPDLVRDHLYLTDAAEALALAIERVPPGTYNVGGGGHTMAELAAAIGSAFPITTTIFAGGSGVAKMVDSSAFAAATGFSPRTSLEHGVRVEVDRMAGERR